MDIDDAPASIPLEDRVRLLTGADAFTLHGDERLDLAPMAFSDGPTGVRGLRFVGGDEVALLPNATLLAQSWSEDVAHEVGGLLAEEAERQRIHVVLGPTINLHRSPLGGRHFEALSEDPVLTAGLAAAYVGGLQDNGVGATPKHYVANDSETDRFTVDVRVGERALRELYLLPFEAAVTEAGAWCVMSAYNAVGGTTMTENPLLETPLNTEWGFDGVVVSDWTAVRSRASARAAQDLAMPGPEGPWGDALVAAVRAGEVEEAAVDRKVLRLLRLAARVGALEGHLPRRPSRQAEDGPAFAREAAVEGMVLLRNAAADGGPELPWDGGALRRLAVLGDAARGARTQGGGSATVLPASTVSPLDGLRAALPGVEVTFVCGAVVQTGVTGLPLEELVNPATGQPGARVRFVAADGAELRVEDRLATAPLVWFGGDAPVTDSARVELTTRWVPQESGAVRIGFATVGHGRLWVDDELLLDEAVAAVAEDAGAALLAPPSIDAPLLVTAGTPVDLRFHVVRDGSADPLPGALGFAVGTEPVVADEAAEIADAARAAAEADVALVVVGTNSVVESEGYDRESLALPGRQDDLVRAVAAANPRTVVLVNAGAPVLMPWRDDVAAVLLGWFGGQEFGSAVADVLLGVAEPGGRLPTTWPAAQEDVPVLSTTPVEGRLEYAEGIHTGYRAWLRQQADGGAAPAYWFGHGLGYADVRLVDVRAPARATAGEVVTVQVEVENTSGRTGKQVVQVYAERADSAVDRPIRWLVGSSVVRVPAGQRATVEVAVPTRYLAHWDAGWTSEPGDYTLRVGTSAVDLPLRTVLTLGRPG